MPKFCDEAVRRVFPVDGVVPEWSEMTTHQRLQVIYWNVRLDSTYGSEVFRADCESIARDLVTVASASMKDLGEEYQALLDEDQAASRDPDEDVECSECAGCGAEGPLDELGSCDICGDLVCKDCGAVQGDLVYCKVCVEEHGMKSDPELEDEE